MAIPGGKKKNNTPQPEGQYNAAFSKSGEKRDMVHLKKFRKITPEGERTWEFPTGVNLQASENTSLEVFSSVFSMYFRPVTEFYHVLPMNL